MNLWQWTATLLLLALFPCASLCFFKKGIMDRVIGFQMACVVEVLTLMVLAQASGQASFFDIALCMTILTFGGGFVFVRFIERWRKREG